MCNIMDGPLSGTGEEERAMAQLSLNILKLPVQEMARAVAFYRDMLGFRLLFQVEEFGWAQLDRDGIALALYLPGEGGGDRTPGGSADFHLICDNLVEFWRELLQRGLELEEGIVSGEDTTAFIDLPDSEGNIIRIIQAEQDRN
ncbi:MAG: VOC family protein [Candidatus Cloacimonetes bacterium]|nr:VOC family protein [Candidatus Cloacimonadota bacterium]